MLRLDAASCPARYIHYYIYAESVKLTAPHPYLAALVNRSKKIQIQSAHAKRVNRCNLRLVLHWNFLGSKPQDRSTTLHFLPTMSCHTAFRPHVACKSTKIYWNSKGKAQKVWREGNISTCTGERNGTQFLLKEIGIMGIIIPYGQAYDSYYSNFFHFLLFGFLSTLPDRILFRVSPCHSVAKRTPWPAHSQIATGTPIMLRFPQCWGR